MNLKQSESETIEYKESLAEKKEVGKDICAFANKNGGTVYFGVKNNGEIKGIPMINENTIRELSQFYFDNTEPRIITDITVEDFHGAKIIKITIPKSNEPHHTYREIPYIRISSESKKMPQSEYQSRLIKYKGIGKLQDFSSTTVNNATINDLSDDAIKIFRKLLTQSKRFEQNIDKLNNEDLLKNLQLLQGSKLTIAALVLLAKTESLNRLLPFSEIRFGYKINENEIRNQDTEIYKGGYFLYFDKIWDKINSRNITLSIPHGMLIAERKAFDEETIREAINNTIIHRDYQLTESIFISQSQQNIEIKNPGGFVDGINLNNILEESKPRNKLIAEILYKCDLVEQFGNGVNLMFKNQLSAGKLPPDYSESNEERVVLRINGSIQDVEFAKYILKVSDKQQRDLSDKELIILNNIKENKKIKSSELSRNLLESGLIEKIGYGKYILSKKYYSDTKQRGLYVNKKRTVYITYKTDLYNYFKEYETVRMNDLIGEKGTLFEERLKKFQVNRLLTQLRDEGKIKFTGDPRSIKSFWQIVK